MSFRCPAIAIFLCLGAALVAPLVLAQPDSAKLVNIATRGQVGTDANLVIGGFTITGASKTVLVRAVGPGLANFGVPGTLADPLLEIIDSKGATVASNDNWNAVDAATMSAVGAFPLLAASKDAVVVATLPPGGYSAKVSGLGGNNTGVAIMEVYDVSGGGQVVNIATRLQVGTGANSAFAGFVVSPGAGTRKLLVRGVGPALAAFGLPGTLPDPKLTLFDGNSQTIATAVANGNVAALASATAQSGAFPASSGDAATIVTVSPGSYTVQLSGNNSATTGVGLIEVYDITNSTGTPANLASTTPRLYYSSLRPNANAATSTASGYATILYDPNTNVATVSVNFSNLSSSATSAHLVIGTNASSGNFVFNLPRGQANALTWTFPSTGSYSTADLIAALQNGQLFVSIDSTSFPAGELQGGFALSTGSTRFTAPAAPPALSAGALNAPSQTDAARFLTQATFGPTTDDIATVTTRGITQWINDQIALPMTSHHAALLADVAAFPNPIPPPGIAWKRTYAPNRAAAEWKIMITAPDQLRQRMALALSEILVISSVNDALSDNAEAIAKYHDLLTAGAFGNFRQLLEDVTLSPAMGVFLSYVLNMKANPVTGTSPDENYAREIQQLFTIGLVQLQPDGTLMLDASGQPIPTYNQEIISETAKVFTGWAYAVPGAGNNFTAYPTTPANLPAPDPTNGWLNPMRYFDAQHDKTAKRVIGLQQVPLATATPTVIPANQTGPQDLKIMLDTLFNHPNTGPFIVKQLIQRFVTSNPSPGYVYRVAQVFANDGAGVRGNLGAVVRAILTDYEARSPAVTANVGYGKLKEPLIRTVGFFRVMKASAANGRFLDSWFGDPRNSTGYGPTSPFADPNGAIGQAALQAPSVFNYFFPDYSPPGVMAAAGLVAPEMQITDAISALIVPNNMFHYLYRENPPVTTAPSPSPFVFLNFAEFLPNARNSPALIDQLNLLFCGNSMTAATRARVTTAHQSAVNNTSPTVTDTERVRVAMHLVLASPDAAVQR